MQPQSTNSVQNNSSSSSSSSRRRMRMRRVLDVWADSVENVVVGSWRRRWQQTGRRACRQGKETGRRTNCIHQQETRTSCQPQLTQQLLCHAMQLSQILADTPTDTASPPWCTWIHKNVKLNKDTWMTLCGAHCGHYVVCYNYNSLLSLDLSRFTKSLPFILYDRWHFQNKKL